MKNLQFLTNQAQTLAILPIHEIVIFTKFQVNWAKIVDFSLIAYFRTSAIFYDSVSIFQKCTAKIFYKNRVDLGGQIETG